MRILFMGTPSLAAECLKKIYEKEGVIVVGVLTQTDKPKGRSMKLTPSPVKELALMYGIPVYQPKTLRDGAFREELERLDPEMIIVAAYGKILPDYVLDYPKYGCINAHGSLLPKYRGAAPIQRAVIDGESETGITAMYMDAGLDTGDIIKKYPCAIDPEEDFGSLYDRLAVIAGDAMCDVIDMAEGGCVPREPQTGESSYAAKIEKEDTVIDFTKTAREIKNLVRGLSPAPLAVTRLPDGKLLKITRAAVPETAENADNNAVPGMVVSLDAHGVGYIGVKCADGVVLFTGVVPEGKKPMNASDFIRGRKINEGDVLKY